MVLLTFGRYLKFNPTPWLCPDHACSAADSGRHLAAYTQPQPSRCAAAQRGIPPYIRPVLPAALHLRPPSLTTLIPEHQHLTTLLLLTSAWLSHRRSHSTDGPILSAW